MTDYFEMDGRIHKEILYFGKYVLLSCDGRCEKAWGISHRPSVALNSNNEDDYAWLADGELEEAPDDPGTYEGGQGKPTPDEKLESKWCARECERSTLTNSGEHIEPVDLSQRFYNIRPHTREVS